MVCVGPTPLLERIVFGFPGVESAFEDFGVGEALLLVYDRQPGGRALILSGAVNDNFLFFREREQFFLELSPRQGSFQHFVFTLLVVIGANQDCVSSLRSGPGLFYGNAFNRGRILSLAFAAECHSKHSKNCQRAKRQQNYVPDTHNRFQASYRSKSGLE